MHPKIKVKPTQVSDKTLYNDAVTCWPATTRSPPSARNFGRKIQSQRSRVRVISAVLTLEEDTVAVGYKLSLLIKSKDEFNYD